MLKLDEFKYAHIFQIEPFMDHLRFSSRFDEPTSIPLRPDLLQELQVQPDLIPLFLRPLDILHSLLLAILSHSINVYSMLQDAFMLAFEQVKQILDALPLLVVPYATLYQSTARLVDFKVVRVHMHFLVDIESVQDGFNIDFTWDFEEQR